jgi:DNA-binding NarL/FixJ family response regulator
MPVGIGIAGWPIPGSFRGGLPALLPRYRRIAVAARRSFPGVDGEVAQLVAKGLNNKSIANRLSVGEKTIEKYVTAIYAKLSFSTRAQLAAYIARAETTR